MTHQDGDLAYIIATKNIKNRADHEFTNWNKAIEFGKGLPDGVDWELRRCRWAHGRWHRAWSIPEIMADFDRAIILQEEAYHGN